MFDEGTCHCVMHFTGLLIICPHWNVQAPSEAGIYICFLHCCRPSIQNQCLGVNTGWVDTRSGWSSPQSWLLFSFHWVPSWVPWAEIKDFTPSGGSRKGAFLALPLLDCLHPWSMASCFHLQSQPRPICISQTIALSPLLCCFCYHLVRRLSISASSWGDSTGSPR